MRMHLWMEQCLYVQKVVPKIAIIASIYIYIPAWLNLEANKMKEQAAQKGLSLQQEWSAL